MQILTEPKNAIIKQYQQLIKMDEVNLGFEDDAIEAIAEEALRRKTGARALRSIIEEMMLEVMYEIPSRADIETLTITKDMVLKKKSAADILKFPEASAEEDKLKGEIA